MYVHDVVYVIWYSMIPSVLWIYKHKHQGRIQEKGEGGGKFWGYAHFRWSKTRENPILSQGKSHLRLQNCCEQSPSQAFITAFKDITVLDIGLQLLSLLVPSLRVTSILTSICQWVRHRQIIFPRQGGAWAPSATCWIRPWTRGRVACIIIA